ncbi:MAG: STAS domain-containing protein [Syntrophales bacterium]|nr:STAS domain-containing protein [Syntrophales bacterium]MDD5232969.1 STAS domain-containing protein [Syntrophales bacterium]MDD5532412.1 STAS domain-containing protein [Syntrophales bacterium]HPL62250.1 STAS domain-containing protein [Syntrophales bacterium]
MEIRSSKDDGVIVVSVQGRMDAVTAPDFDQCLEKFLQEGEKKFVIDFSGLEYISSAGLQSLLKTAKQLENTGGLLHLSNLRGSVRDVFEISGFDSIFRIFPSKEVALEPLR